MINPIKCLICGFLAGSVVGLGVLFSGKQSKHLPLLLTVTGLAGMAGTTSTLHLLTDKHTTKRMLVRGLRDLKGNYEDLDKLVEIEMLEQKIWKL